MLRAHHRAKRRRNRDLRAVGLPDAGAVLRGDPRPGEDRLSLREQVRLPLAGRLLGSEPLQRGRRRPRLVGDDDRAVAVGQLHRERPPLDGIGVAKRVLERGAAAIRDFLDVEVACVEHELSCAGTPLKRQRRRAAELVRLHVGPQVERDMRDARLGRPRERVDVGRLLLERRLPRGSQPVQADWNMRWIRQPRRQPRRRTPNLEPRTKNSNLNTNREGRTEKRELRPTGTPRCTASFPATARTSSKRSSSIARRVPLAAEERVAQGGRQGGANPEVAGRDDAAVDVRVDR